MHRLLFFVLLLSVAGQAAAREVGCESDGDTADYRQLLQSLNADPLCALSSEYEAAFRVVLVPAAGEPKGVTIYQSHLGELDAVAHPDSQGQPLSDQDYASVLEQFKSLDMFTLASQERVAEQLCSFGSGEGPEACAMGFDGSQLFIEASYGSDKRTLERWGSLVGGKGYYLEPEYQQTFYQLLNLID